MLDAPRAVPVAVVLVAGLLSGCGTADSSPVPPPPPLPAGPAPAPSGGPAAAGAVLALGAPATGVAVDPRTRTLAVALADPPRLQLRALDADLTAAREVPLPGPATDLVLAAEGGPLLVAVAEPGSLVRVPLDGAAPTRTDLDGTPRGVLAVGGRTVVALGERLTVLGAEGPRTIPGFTDAARLAPAGGSAGTKVAVLDRGRTALSLVDVASGEAGSALRAGNGAVNAVADRFGRIVVTDVRDGELLLFGGDPLLLRQRFPLPGAPYGLAYDRQRDLAWVTLTARNEVVGLDVAGGEPVIVYRFPTVHQPDAVAVDPVSGRVVIVSASGAGLQVIDPERVVH